MNTQIVEMRQQKAQLLEKMSALNGLVKKEQRDFTISETEQWEGMEREVRRVEGQITRDEVQEKRQADLASTAFHNGETGRHADAFDGAANGAGRRNTNGAGYETTSAILRPDQSVRSYMQEHGLIRPELEGLSLGGLLRAKLTGVARNDLDRRALGEVTDSAGGFSVPDVVAAPFIDRMRSQIVCIRAGGRTVPLTSDKTTIVRIASDPTVSWRIENAAVAISDPTFEGVVLAPKSAAAIVKVSQELLDDSINVEAMLETSLAGAFAVEIDRVCLVGSGIAPEPQGIYGLTNVGSVTSVGKPADFTKFTQGLYELQVDNEMTVTGMVMHPRTSSDSATW